MCEGWNSACIALLSSDCLLISKPLDVAFESQPDDFFYEIELEQCFLNKGKEAHMERILCTNNHTNWAESCSRGNDLVSKVIARKTAC